MNRWIIGAIVAVLGQATAAERTYAVDQKAVIRGTPGDDVLVGTPRSDTIFGFAGNDNISGRGGDDRLFGGPGFDTFRWFGGGGRDRINGGADGGSLQIVAGKNLRLHINALTGGLLRAPTGSLQVIDVADLEGIFISGTDAANKIVLSTEEGIVGDSRLDIATGGGRDIVDVRKVHNQIGSIFAGAGDDAIWLSEGNTGALVLIRGDPGDDEIHLGGDAADVDFGCEVFTGETDGHDTIHGFGKTDRILLAEARNAPGLIDTNGDGRLSAKDKTVTIKNGSMTIDVRPICTGVTFTLIGRTSLRLERILILND